MNDEQYYAAINAIDEETEMLEHHGILGMKWGIRRYQNPDGSLTELGKKHYGDGTDHKTEKAIEKFNQQKSIAIAKGDTDFARKNIDYLSNDELSRFKERISARTSLDDLKQASRKITADKLDSWAKMVSSGANMLDSGIRAYNSAAKIINAVTGKKLMPQLKDNQGPTSKDEYKEVWRNGVRESKYTTTFDETGKKTVREEHFNTKSKDKDKDKDEKKKEKGGGK